MKFQIRKMAAALALILAMSLCMQAFAATSPNSAPKSYVNNSKLHSDKTVITQTNKAGTRARVTKVTANKGGASAYILTVSTAKNKNKKKIPIQFIGNGEKGVFNSKAGRIVTSVIVNSKVTVRVAAKAFTGSKVNTIKIQSPTTFYENAFAATIQKSVTFRIDGKGKKLVSSDIVFKAGSFTGLKTKSSKVIVYGSRMTETEFNKLKKKLVRQGFKGSITYYSNR